GFAATIRPYVKSVEVMRCPSDVGETWPLMPGGFQKRTLPFCVLYGLSYYWLGRGLDNLLPGRVASTVRRPASVVLLFEPRPWHGSPKPDDSYRTTTDLFNVLYCDGHVKPQPYDQIQQDRDSSFGNR